MTNGRDEKEKERCWKRIGVWGKEVPRCPELEKVIHCRNCDVFTRAGRSLLEQDVPLRYQEDWQQVLQEKKQEQPRGSLSAVVFRVGGEWISLPARIFSEVIDKGLIHSIPHRKNRILIGVINIHGEIHLCVSLRHLLCLEEGDGFEDCRDPSRRMMVVSSSGETWVFPVDQILGVYRVHPALFQKAPATVSKAEGSFTRGIFYWDGKYVAFLDEERLFRAFRSSVQ